MEKSERQQLKQDIKDLLIKFIPKPNLDVLSVTVNFDPNLNSITVKYYSLSLDKEVLILDEL